MEGLGHTLAYLGARLVTKQTAEIFKTRNLTTLEVSGARLAMATVVVEGVAVGLASYTITSCILQHFGYRG